MPPGRRAASVVVDGHTAPGLGSVADTFAALLASGDELGGAVAAMVDGHLVVDLWGGSADDKGRPWREETLVNAFSVGKPLVAACLWLLVDRGLVGLDDTVARHWPEFAAARKEAISVRHVLAHQAGLDFFEQPLPRAALLDWATATALLAASAPRWPPGSTHGEHAAFYGHLVGEIVRRVDGRGPGEFLRREIAAPWALDLAVGLGRDEIARTADVVDPGGAFARTTRGAGATYLLALDNPPAMLDPHVVNGAPWRSAEIPAVNLHATARAVARFYAGLGAGGTLDGVRLLSPGLVARCVAAERAGHDEVLGRDVSWGLGVQVDEDGYGMGGLGGNVGWWSREGYALAYLTRRLGTHDRADAIEQELRHTLGLPPLDDGAASAD